MGFEEVQRIRHNRQSKLLQNTAPHNLDITTTYITIFTCQQLRKRVTSIGWKITASI